MNVRKSSLPVSTSEKTLWPKSNNEVSSIANIWIEAKQKFVSSCSKINNNNHYNLEEKPHSFPGSNLDIQKSFVNSDTSNSFSGLEKSNSTQSITDTLSKVRRLTHVYDNDEALIPHLSSPDEHVAIGKDSTTVHLPTEVVGQIVENIDEKKLSKIGDKNYRLPTKAAAILGADDKIVLQSLHDNSLSSKIQHALFLDQKSNDQKNKKPPQISESDPDAYMKYIKSKRKTGLGSEVKEKIASFWKQTDQPLYCGSSSISSNHPGSTITTHNSNLTAGLQLKDMERLLRVGKSSVEQFKRWSKSFECLLHDKYGLALFHDFLRSEFSDENIEFWIACEEYRTITNNKKLQSRAEKIYNDFVGVQAAREVNLDSKTRQQTEIDIRNPTCHTFDQAQKRIQALMEKDSYQRFLRSELYGRLLRACEEYQLSQVKAAKDPLILHKGPTISSLGITAQDLSKLTLTTSKLGCTSCKQIVPTKAVNHDEHVKSQVKQPDVTSINTVHPDEPSLPFSKSSLIFKPEN